MITKSCCTVSRKQKHDVASVEWSVVSEWRALSGDLGFVSTLNVLGSRHAEVLSVLYQFYFSKRKKQKNMKK